MSKFIIDILRRASQPSGVIGLVTIVLSLFSLKLDPDVAQAIAGVIAAGAGLILVIVDEAEK